MNDAELIVWARDCQKYPDLNQSLIHNLADALERHARPLPEDVAGLVEALHDLRNWIVPSGYPVDKRARDWIDAIEKAAALIAVQAREIERLEHDLKLGAS